MAWIVRKACIWRACRRGVCARVTINYRPCYSANVTCLLIWCPCCRMSFLTVISAEDQSLFVKTFSRHQQQITRLTLSAPWTLRQTASRQFDSRPATLRVILRGAPKGDLNALRPSSSAAPVRKTGLTPVPLQTMRISLSHEVWARRIFSLVSSLCIRISHFTLCNSLTSVAGWCRNV